MGERIHRLVVRMKVFKRRMKAALFTKPSRMELVYLQWPHHRQRVYAPVDWLAANFPAWARHAPENTFTAHILASLIGAVLAVAVGAALVYFFWIPILLVAGIMGGLAMPIGGIAGFFAGGKFAPEVFWYLLVDTSQKRAHVYPFNPADYAQTVKSQMANVSGAKKLVLAGAKAGIGGGNGNGHGNAVAVEATAPQQMASSFWMAEASSDKVWSYYLDGGKSKREKMIQLAIMVFLAVVVIITIFLVINTQQPKATGDGNGGQPVAGAPAK